MLHVPAEWPVTTPPLVTEATATLLLLHVPPGTKVEELSYNVLELPTQTPRVPYIAADELRDRKRAHRPSTRVEIFLINRMVWF